MRRSTQVNEEEHQADEEERGRERDGGEEIERGGEAQSRPSAVIPPHLLAR
jgi:hypothetical protein